jgi:PqqD family protein of HPr-rel-A system
VLYAPESNDVHVLNPAARDMLLLLQGHALTIEEISERLSPGSDERARLEIRAGIAETLAELDRAGLIRPLVA